MGVNPFSRYIKLSGLSPGASGRACRSTRSNIDTYARRALPPYDVLASVQKIQAKLQFTEGPDDC